MGLALTIFGVAYGLFEIPGGWLADRFGPRRVLTGGVTWQQSFYLFGSIGFVWAILFWFYLTWLPTYIREQFGLQQADQYLAALLAAPPLFLAGVTIHAHRTWL